MIINLCPHKVDFYPEAAFQNLEQLNPTTWVADSVDESKLMQSFEASGTARISTKTVPANDVDGIPCVTTQYGELTGFPEIHEGDVYIVSLPTQSMAKASGHPLASVMASPYKVVRLRSNTSNILGCMGLSFQ